MNAMEAKDAIQFLAKEIAADIDRSAQGRNAYEQANLEGPSHISAIIVSEADLNSENMLSFRAFVELNDQNDNQYEAEIKGLCERIADDSGPRWKKIALDVIDAGPLPMGG